MHRVLLLAPFAFIAACTAADPLPGDPGDDLGSTTSHQAAGCSKSREEILAAAGPTRAAAISRGFEWLDANVPYSQSASHEGYRTDCSGFVSMCWSLPQSFTTADFAAGTAGNTLLGSYDDLQPGDGLVRRSGGSGHAVLFLGWNDDAHSEACVLEEASTATDMNFGVRATSSLTSQGFKAMRADGMPDADPSVTASADADDAPIDDPILDDPTTTTDPETVPLPPPKPAIPHRAGDACSSDEDCNPGLSGTGLICNKSRAKCEPGCKFDLQCPGKQLCKANKCV